MEENNLYEKIEKAFTIDEKISNIIFQYLNTFIEKIKEKHQNIEKTLRVLIIGSNLPVKIPVEPQYTPAKTLKQIKTKLKEKFGEKIFTYSLEDFKELKFLEQDYVIKLYVLSIFAHKIFIIFEAEEKLKTGELIPINPDPLLAYAYLIPLNLAQKITILKRKNIKLPQIIEKTPIIKDILKIKEKEYKNIKELTKHITKETKNINFLDQKQFITT